MAAENRPRSVVEAVAISWVCCFASAGARLAAGAKGTLSPTITRTLPAFTASARSDRTVALVRSEVAAAPAAVRVWPSAVSRTRSAAASGAREQKSPKNMMIQRKNGIICT